MIMDSQNQPILQPFLQLLPTGNIGRFQTIVMTYLSSSIGKNPDLIRDFANPTSPIYQELYRTFFVFDHGSEVKDWHDDSMKKAMFFNDVIKPLKMAIDFGLIMAGEKAGSHHHESSSSSSSASSSSSSTSPSPSSSSSSSSSSQNQRITQPEKPSKSIPIAPRFTIKSTNSPSSPTNSLYVSNLPPGVNRDANAVVRVLTTLCFPQELIHDRQILHRPGPHNSCFLQGPSDDPEWAQKMMEAKLVDPCVLRDSKIHVAYARPKATASSPGRTRKMEEINARLNEISLGLSALSPSSSPSHALKSPITPAGGRGDNNTNRQGSKRPAGDARVSLFQGDDNMEVEKDSPSSKHMNTQQTPAAFRQRSGVNKEEEKKEEESHPMNIATPHGKQSPRSDRSYKDAVVHGQDDETINFDSALTPSLLKGDDKAET